MCLTNISKKLKAAEDIPCWYVAERIRQDPNWRSMYWFVKLTKIVSIKILDFTVTFCLDPIYERINICSNL